MHLRRLISTTQRMRAFTKCFIRLFGATPGMKISAKTAGLPRANKIELLGGCLWALESECSISDAEREGQRCASLSARERRLWELTSIRTASMKHAGRQPRGN